jgi:hypothetical protein
MQNPGLENEKAIIAALDGREVGSLNKSLKNLILSLFPDSEGILSCQKGYPHEKPDLVIRLGDKTKYVSVKSGRSISVHEESLSTLIPFFPFLGDSRTHLENDCLFPLWGWDTRWERPHPLYFQ